MNDTASLLGQLKIDRGPDIEPPPRRWPWLLVALLAAGGLGALLLYKNGGLSKAVPVSVAVATPLAGNAGTGGGSLLDASGYVVARLRATVSAKVTGKLQDLYIEEGQRVEEGQVIARLDSSNAQAAVLEAQARVSQALASLAASKAAADNIRPIHERNIQQARAGIISSQALENSKASFDAQQLAVGVAQQTLAVAQASLVTAERNVADTVVRAPFSGVITEKAAQPGEIVSPMSAGGGFTRTGIGTLVDMDSLEVEVDVNENFLNRVRQGQPATAKLNAYPDWDIPAEVVAVIPTADRSKATVKVRVGFKVKDPRILPDMGVRVSFLSDAAKGQAKAATGVSLPAAAVQAERGAATGNVYVIDGDHVARREVSLGAAIAGDQLTVLSGINAGDRVAIGAFDKLGDGTQVRLVDPSK